MRRNLIQMVWINYSTYDAICAKSTDFSRLHSGGGSRFVWDAFWFKGTFELAFLRSGRMQKATSTHSDTTYFRSRILITAQNSRFSRTIHQFRAPKSYSIFYPDQRVDVMKYRPKFPDINQDENLWVTLIKRFLCVRKVAQDETRACSGDQGTLK